MRKISRYMTIICLYALVYMVLVENVSWLNFVIGLAVSCIAIAFSNRYLLFNKYEQLFPIKFSGFFIYFFYLMIKVMQSGIKAAVITIKGNEKLHFEQYISSLPNDFTLNLLANSITLTPGTVTVNRNGNDLLIMQLSKESESFDDTDIMEFEKKIFKLIVRESD